MKGPATNLQVEGNSGGFKDQWRLYYELIQFDFIHTVCETGKFITCTGILD